MFRSRPRAGERLGAFPTNRKRSKFLPRERQRRGWDTHPVAARRKAISPLSRRALPRSSGGSKGGDACARRANYARSRAGGSPLGTSLLTFCVGRK